MEQTLVIKKFDRLTPREVYEMLRLRTAVFVVEQECPYQEVDGTDYDSLHVWLEENDEIVAYLRIFEKDADKIFQGRIKFYSKNFIYTMGADGAKVFNNEFAKKYDGKKITPVSTVGAGDNFNAGIIYGMIKENITSEDLLGTIEEERWNRIVNYAIEFSAFVCTTLDNYISPELAEQFK